MREAEEHQEKTIHQCNDLGQFLLD